MPDETKSLEQLQALLTAADITRAEVQELRRQIDRLLTAERRADLQGHGDQRDRQDDQGAVQATNPACVEDVAFGSAVALQCGCSGKRWWERRGLVWLSIVRACSVHHEAMYDGLWVLPSLPLRVSAPATLQLGLQMVRHPERPRVIVKPSRDGSTLAICERAAQQRVKDGTWAMGTLIEAGAMVTSLLDAQLLAEHTAAMAQRHGLRGPIALVAPDDGQFEIAMTWARCSAVPTPRPFRAQSEAVAWLRTLGF